MSPSQGLNPFFLFLVHNISTKPHPPFGLALIKFIYKEVSL